MKDKILIVNKGNLCKPYTKFPKDLKVINNIEFLDVINTWSPLAIKKLINNEIIELMYRAGYGDIISVRLDKIKGLLFYNKDQIINPSTEYKILYLKEISCDIVKDDETMKVIDDYINEDDTVRLEAFSYDGTELKTASEHAMLLEDLNIVENAYDTEDDPRNLFPSNYLIGTIHRVNSTGYLIYEIVCEKVNKEILINFINNVSKSVYIFDYSNRVFRSLCSGDADIN